MPEKKKLPIPITEEQWSSIDHAVIARNLQTTAISQSYQEPTENRSYKVDFQTVKVIKEPSLPHQIQQHIRFTDIKTGQTYDVDTYLQAREVRKYLALAEEMKIKNIPYKMTSQPTEPEEATTGIQNIMTHTGTTEDVLTIQYFHNGQHIRTAKVRLETK